MCFCVCVTVCSLFQSAASNCYPAKDQTCMSANCLAFCCAKLRRVTVKRCHFTVTDKKRNFAAYFSGLIAAVEFMKIAQICICHRRTLTVGPASYQLNHSTPCSSEAHISISLLLAVFSFFFLYRPPHIGKSNGSYSFSLVLSSSLFLSLFSRWRR